MSLGFNTALSALTAARVALETIGHNIANANTDGYSRQRVLMSAFMPQPIGPGLAVGSGVGVDSIDQVFDPILTTRLRAQAQELGRASGQADVYDDLQGALGEPSDSGLNARFSSFFAALTNLQTTPGDQSARTGAIQSASTLAQTFRTVASDLSAVSNTVEKSVEYEVNKVNQTVQDLSDLNHAIVVSGFGGQIPPDIRDKQNQLIQQLSQSVDVHVTQTPTGQVSVSSGGQVLVDPNGSNQIRILPTQITGNAIALRAGTSTVDFKPKSGRLSSLLDTAPQTASDTQKAIDDLAHSLIAQVNHAHATGVPPGGGYTKVSALHPFQDTDGNGDILGEKLVQAGLPFEMQNGYLTVSVHDSSGNTTQTRLAVLPDHTTVQDFVGELNSVAHVNASIDSTGRLQIASDSGYTFDFSSSLNATPDTDGTFGGGKPTLVTAIPFPLTIPPNLTFTLQVDGGAAQTVTLNPNQFSIPGQATADELAATINAQVTGVHAFVSSGRLVLQGNTVGASGSLKFNNGVTVVGQDNPVKTTVSGTFTGTADESFILSPATDGVIGQTPGLKVNVSRPDGTVVGTLDVGLGYTPGTELALPDGIKVSFTAGAVSRSGLQFERIDAITDGDQSGVLTATGVNALFDGSDASTISASQQLLDDPSLLATSLGGGPSDGSNIARLLNAKTQPDAALGGRSLVDRLDLLVQSTGAGADRAQTTVETQQALMDQLESRRQAVSGVNVDEELLNMEQYQQAFIAATRYTQTLSEVNQTLITLGQ